MDIEKVRALIKLAKEEDLKVLRVADMDTEVHIEMKSDGVAVQSTAPARETGSASEGNEDSGLHTIKAAQVGTFYTHKEEGGDETFVKAGDAVSAGDQIGMIEAMKVFNDVFADADGTVEEIFAENGETVEYDQPLLTIRPKED